MGGAFGRGNVQMPDVRPNFGEQRAVTPETTAAKNLRHVPTSDDGALIV